MKLWQWLPIVVILAPLLATVAVIWLWNRLTDRSKKRNPLTQDLLRSPGESLREQIEDISWDLATYFGVAPAPLMFAYGVYISSLAFEGKPPPFAVIIIYGFLVVLAQGWLVWKIWTQLHKKRRLTLGYEAELAIGQELNQLGRVGFHVFHDLPAKDFNIDHVAVGPSGVFAIETKGRAKFMAGPNGKSGWEVGYDGKSLEFPGWRETKSLEQAVRQAKWLKEWLSSAVGEPVRVHPILILPGWFVRRTSPIGIPVLTGTTKQILSFFPKAGDGTRLSDQFIQRVVHQLDQRCRNVAPRAYRDAQQKS